MHQVVLGDTESMFTKRFATGSIALLAIAVVLLIAGSLLPRSPLISLSPDQPANASMLDAAEGKLASDKMMINPVNYTYLAGANLSNDAGQGHVYQLLLEGRPESVLARAAAALGVSGEVKQSSQWSPESPSYFIGTEDGTGSSVNIWWGGTGNWYFNNFVTASEPECKITQKAEDGSEYCSEYVEQKPTPELLPSESQIVRDALRIFNATGLSVSKQEISVYKDDWSAGASASLSVAGQETAITWNIGYDSKGRLAWAGGHSVRVVDRGSYDTVSAVAAVQRLSDWRWYGSPAQGEFPVYSVTNRDVSTPAQPEQQPTEVTVTIKAAKPLLLQVWDKNFGSWLVPGLALTGDEGSVNFVVSLIEGVIELPDPVMVEPMVDPMFGLGGASGNKG
ncbi:MAG: hypothetical protein RJB56_127 [Actinomycetota bacterium]